MVSRHRIPTIFNLSMVDVLCCALGCVILLWLLNLREAKQRALEAGEADLLLGKVRAQLIDTEHHLGETTAQLENIRVQKERTLSRLEVLEKDRQKVNADLRSAQSRLSGLDQALTTLKNNRAATEERLAKKMREQQDQAKEMAKARQRMADLDLLIREKESMVKATARSADDLAERLRDADARTKQLRARADLLPGLQEKLSTSVARQQALEKEVSERTMALNGAGRTIESLQEEKRQLFDQARRVRAATENRFAGIELTGRRVIFLVDMSGSMELVDENTAAPEKWVGVRETLAKLMRSLPLLEKFQVILFSNRVLYPLGNEGHWLDYDPVSSTSNVAQVMAATKPNGNTDMYAGFESAFRFKPMGLDTIYVLSDGLPNIGNGLSPEAAGKLKETEKSEILSKYMRQTLLTSWNVKGAGKPRVKINAVGFFYESPDVGAFLWALARENDGSFVGMSKP